MTMRKAPKHRNGHQISGTTCVAGFTSQKKRYSLSANGSRIAQSKMNPSPVQKKRKRGFPNKDQRDPSERISKEKLMHSPLKSCLADWFLGKTGKDCLPVGKLRRAVQKFRKKPAALSFFALCPTATKRSLEHRRKLKRE
jgi:hypothetical protein